LGDTRIVCNPAIFTRKIRAAARALSAFRTRIFTIVVALSFTAKYCDAMAALVDDRKAQPLSEKD
jgi:hypothetical protein